MKTTRRLDAWGGRGSGDGSSGWTQEFFTSGHRIGPPHRPAAVARRKNFYKAPDDSTPRRRLMIRIKFLGDGSRTGDGWLSSGALAATGCRVRRVDARTFLQIGGPCITQHDKKTFENHSTTRRLVAQQGPPWQSMGGVGWLCCRTLSASGRRVVGCFSRLLRPSFHPSYGLNNTCTNFY